jgi:hypothetical protein
MIAVVDVDDLVCEEQIVDLLLPLQRKLPEFLVTAYTVPNKFGPITPELRRKYPWITFGIHGWEHTPFECQAWSDVDTERHIMRALAMGYDPLFKAPNWELHDEVVAGCATVGVTLHHHEAGVPPTRYGCRLFPGPYPRPRTYANVHTHILRNPVTDYISEHPGFEPENLLMWEGFATPLNFARKT